MKEEEKMATVTGRSKLCVDICKSLGLKNVKKFDLHMAVDEIVTVTVEFYPEVDGVLQLPAILKKFELIEKIDSEKIEETTSIGDKIKDISI